jgi:hypothetical protein
MSADSRPTASRSFVHEQLMAECRVMVRHALGAGLKIQPTVLAQLHQDEALLEGGEVDIEGLARAHESLAQLVAPARPQLLMHLNEESTPGALLRWTGRIPLMRRMMLMAILSLGTFIALSLSPYINDAKAGNIFLSSGFPLFINELFFLSSAALGASFSALSQIERDIGSGVFDPSDQSSYWSRLLLGLMSGLLLATLINFNPEPTGEAGEGEHSMAHMTSAAMALLGGFSSSVVYRILNRMVEALETMVRGSVEEMTAVHQRAAQARMNQQLLQERLKLASRLSELQRQFANGQDPEAASQQLTMFVLALLHGGSGDAVGSGPASATPPSTPAAPPVASEERSPVSPSGSSNGRLRVRYPESWVGGPGTDERPP